MPASSCIHGRFQIFHHDHLRYLREAWSRSERLIIGITSVEGLRGSNSTSHRSEPRDNPLSYFERIEMIRAALEEIPEIEMDRISFSPFPIEQPHLMPGFIPRSVTCHTTIREPWNQQKANLLRELGYRVSILYEDHDKQISASQIRELIRQNDPAWETLVPRRVRQYLDREKIIERLRQTL